MWVYTLAESEVRETQRTPATLLTKLSNSNRNSLKKVRERVGGGCVAPIPRTWKRDSVDWCNTTFGINHS